MRYLRYSHEVVIPLAVALSRAVTVALGRRLLPLGRRLLPGPAGRRILAGLLLGVSLVVQILLVWMIGELVSLCIDLAELWAVLAKKHLEITL